ncbi:hypothetical protein VTL71DRAFT_9793 [Oculimacula yallundae]|uniref:Xaa-Pro dipeptidyl-peptidase C-terminal domain-containing protein n=1 Tax=Oculimacula yallundae TaxID=86028 RepID=A0ABR4BUN4_9HELO
MTRQIKGINVDFLPAKRELSNVWTAYEPDAQVILPAGWKRGTGRRALREDIIWDKDVAVKMRDGVILRVDIFRPASQADESLPVLLPWSPYGKTGTGPQQTADFTYIGVPKSSLSGLEKFEGVDPAEWCPRGYAIVQPDARGTFRSEGDVHHYGSQEAQDGYDTIEWIAEQRWSNGNVGLVGNSHLGTMQWFIAAEKPPHLKAIAPWEGVGDFYRQSLCRGGIPNPAFWSVLSAGMEGQNLREDFAGMIDKEPHMNAYWEDKNPKIHGIDIPMYALMSYSSGLHTEGSYRGWKYADSKEKWLRIHATQEWHDLYQPENIDDLQRFMDHYLLGKDNGWEFTPKVRVSLLRYNRPPIVHRVEDNYPPSRTRYDTFFLDAAKGRLSLDPVTAYSSTSYQSDSWDDVGSHFTHQFDKYTEILGPSKLKLFISSDQTDDMDIYVIIRKLDRNGTPLVSINVPIEKLPHGTQAADVETLTLYKHLGPNGRLRASKRALGTDPTLSREKLDLQTPTELWFPYDKVEKITPGQVVELNIAIWPAGMAFDVGESMRLEIKGHDEELVEFPEALEILKTRKFLNVGKHPKRELRNRAERFFLCQPNPVSEGPNDQSVINPGYYPLMVVLCHYPSSIVHAIAMHIRDNGCELKYGCGVLGDITGAKADFQLSLGTTTFRIRTQGITILHDTWLDRPRPVKRYLELEDVTELDYIVICHAHFDHLPGADRLALKTGATVIANGEAINCLRRAGVPEAQLVQVAGGERIPLFTRDILEQAKAGTIERAPGPPLAPPRPDSKYASLAVHVWPSLHSLMPGTTPHDIPDVFDTGKIYTGSSTQYDCTLDITRLMQYGLFRMKEMIPEDKMDESTRILSDFVQDREKQIMSHCDGGQLMFNFIIGDKAVLFNTHLGAYEGVLRYMEPKPTIAILGAGGRANLDGRPFEGSAAQFLVNEVLWLKQPEKVYFCLHDESPIKPYRNDVSAALALLKEKTTSEVVNTQPGKSYVLF